MYKCCIKDGTIHRKLIEVCSRGYTSWNKVDSTQVTTLQKDELKKKLQSYRESLRTPNRANLGRVSSIYARWARYVTVCDRSPYANAILYIPHEYNISLITQDDCLNLLFYIIHPDWT